MKNNEFVLCRAPDGGWSLHAPGSTDDDIASGDAPYISCGEGEWSNDEGDWMRPNSADFDIARRAALVKINEGAKQMTKCCRNCTFFPVWEVQDRRGHVLKNRVALCTWTMPPLPSAFWQTKPFVSYTRADDGTNCPCFKERVSS